MAMVAGGKACQGDQIRPRRPEWSASPSATPPTRLPVIRGVSGVDGAPADILKRLRSEAGSAQRTLA